MTGSQPAPPRGSLTFAAACLTVSLAPIAFGVVWGVPQVHRVEPARTEHEIGSNYIAALPPSRFAPLLSTDGDTLEKASRSTLALFEDGRELGPPHAQHAWIREYGGGLFSHWGSSLYFSSSDNSDPRTNGRLYTVRASARLPFVAAWLWLVAPTHLLSGTPGVFAVCGHPSDDALSRNYGVFFASYVGPAEHASRGGR